MSLGKSLIGSAPISTALPPGVVKAEPMEDMLPRNEGLGTPLEGRKPDVDQGLKADDTINSDGLEQSVPSRDRSPNGSDRCSFDEDFDTNQTLRPNSKDKGFSLDPTNADHHLIHRRYFLVRGTGAACYIYCWGVDPAALHMSHISRVERRAKTMLYHCYTFNHSDSNVGSCVQAMGHYFILANLQCRALYRVADNGRECTPVKLYMDEAQAWQAVSDFESLNQLYGWVDNCMPEYLYHATPSDDNKLLVLQTANPQQPASYYSPDPSPPLLSVLDSPKVLLHETLELGAPASTSEWAGPVACGGTLGIQCTGLQQVESPTNALEPSPCCQVLDTHDDPQKNSLNARVAGAERAASTSGASNLGLGPGRGDFSDDYTPSEANSTPRAPPPPPPSTKFARAHRTRVSPRNPGKFFGVHVQQSDVDDWVDRTAENRRAAGKIGNSLMKCPEAGCPCIPRRPHALKTHIYGHYGIKPFKCDKCASKFLTQDGLKKHTGNFHVCPGCSDEMSKLDLRTHKVVCGRNIKSPVAEAGDVRTWGKD